MLSVLIAAFAGLNIYGWFEFRIDTIRFERIPFLQPRPLTHVKTSPRTKLNFQHLQLCVSTPHTFCSEGEFKWPIKYSVVRRLCLRFSSPISLKSICRATQNRERNIESPPKSHLVGFVHPLISNFTWVVRSKQSTEIGRGGVFHPLFVTFDNPKPKLRESGAATLRRQGGDRGRGGGASGTSTAQASVSSQLSAAATARSTLAHANTRTHTYSDSLSPPVTDDHVSLLMSPTGHSMPYKVHRPHFLLFEINFKLKPIVKKLNYLKIV